MRRMISAGPPAKRPPHSEFAVALAEVSTGCFPMVIGRRSERYEGTR